MYKKKIAVVVIAAALMVNTACSAVVPSTLNDDRAGTVVEQPTGQTEPALEDFKVYFDVYMNGGYSDELYNEQLKLEEKGQVYNVLVKSTKQFNELIEKYQLTYDSDVAGSTFNDDFFRNNTILAVMPVQSSSSILYSVSGVEKTDDTLKISIGKTQPEIMTMDISLKAVLLGFSNSYLNGIKSYDFSIVAVQDHSSLDCQLLPASELALGDLTLGSLSVRMTREDVNNILQAEPQNISKDESNKIEKLFYQGLDIVISNGEVSYISTTDSSYPTPRGLKTGDGVNKLIDLYGEPSEIIEYKEKGSKVYSFDLSNEYHLFHAEVKDGIIIRLQVNLAC
ncbi:MAG: hypothetical protein ACOZCL_18120 [Bacillota bacterium]